MTFPFMKRAIQIAQAQNPHITGPNPRVGCVIAKESEVIAEGVTQAYGLAHAEASALNGITSLKGCDIYVTLEPCDHFRGKQTPSCTQTIIAAQPDSVIIGCLDPLFEGKNAAKIKEAGIKVQILGDPECEALNPFFTKYITTKKPYLTLKVAQSLDGRITSNTQYITNEISRQKVHEMRAQYSAILTTTQTIMADNPKLDVRMEGRPNPTQPAIIILGKTKLDPTLNIFQIPNREVRQFDDLETLYKSDAIKKIDSIMTECGTTMNDALLEAKLIDEIRLFTAPIILGSGQNAFTQTHRLTAFKMIQSQDLEGDILQVFRIN